MTPSDDELFRLMTSGVEDAFGALYRRYQGRVFRFALLMSGCPATADDVTQEVFLALLRDADQYDSTRGSLLTYLYGIARKQVLRALKRSRSFIQLGCEPDEEEPASLRHLISQDDPLNEFARNELAGTVRQAVLALPARYREVIVLCDFQEMSYAEAAEALDCSVGTISSRLNRARALLAQKLRAGGKVGRASLSLTVGGA
ncbi:MAG TPA: RNA polymerase sigma factor [Blastocatellia bacterium]|jgi:RNA polymerase sigma-70 factor (ECF subfamily)|nr:RNA polymerase sigma factor [Blastocatellia bacterium]